MPEQHAFGAFAGDRAGSIVWFAERVACGELEMPVRLDVGCGVRAVGRRNVGLSPTAGDIAFARDRLACKHANAHRGGWLAGIAIACLIIGILFSVHITVTAG